MINIIKEMIEVGFSIRKISKTLNVSEYEIKEIVSLNNFKLGKNKFSENEIPKIVSLYEKGVSAKQLGYLYCIDKRRVQKWVKEFGVLRSKNESHRFTYFNQNKFDVIDDQDKAYWLGFLYADCYNAETVNTVSLTLAAKDFAHVVKFAKFMGYPEKEVFYGDIGLNGERYPTANIKLYSKYLCEKLALIGCPKAKSLILKFPNWMRSDLQIHFLRGYFDGDGCICEVKSNNEWKINWCGTFDVLDNISKILKIYCINTSMYQNDPIKNNWTMDSHGNEQVLRICEILYKNANTFLQRKYDKFIKLKEQQNNRKISTIRNNYFINEAAISNIKKDILLNLDNASIIKKYNVSITTIKRIKLKLLFNNNTN